MKTATRSTDNVAPLPTLLMNAPHSPERAFAFTRIIDTTPERVFQAWIDPKQVAQWWGPKCFTNPVCELDARPGGAILIHMCGPDGEVFPMGGTFHEIVENQRIVMTTTAFADEDGNSLLEVRNTITFEEHEGKTKLTVQAVVVKAAPELAGALDGMEEGWSQSLDRLEEVVQNSGSRNKNTRIVAAAGEPTIVISRVFDAPRSLVFEAWTKPEHVRRWWGCRASTLAICEVDLREGGAYRYVMQMPDGSEYPFKGVYREITAPRRLVHTQIFDVEPYSQYEMLVTVTFDEQDGKTTVTETILHSSVEARDGHLASGMATGVGETLSRLEELLAELGGAGSS
ncbi:MAG TPA: SRPBCC domain-containing protein [Abditibacteriaceae bacterium]|jgi:uncharacterized protein YndB with AHSA1/START domain